MKLSLILICFTVLFSCKNKKQPLKEYTITIEEGNLIGLKNLKYRLKAKDDSTAMTKGLNFYHSLLKKYDNDVKVVKKSPFVVKDDAGKNLMDKLSDKTI